MQTADEYLASLIQGGSKNGPPPAQQAQTPAQNGETADDYMKLLLQAGNGMQTPQPVQQPINPLLSSPMIKPQEQTQPQYSYQSGPFKIQDPLTKPGDELNISGRAIQSYRDELARAALSGESYDQIYQRLNQQYIDADGASERTRQEMVQQLAELDQEINQQGYYDFTTPNRQGEYDKLIPFTQRELEDRMAERERLQSSLDKIQSENDENNAYLRYLSGLARAYRYKDLPGKEDWNDTVQAGQAAYEKLAQQAEAERAQRQTELNAGNAEAAGLMYEKDKYYNKLVSDDWTDEEKNTYYYLLAQKDPAAAYEYAEDVWDSIAAEKGAQAREQAEEFGGRNALTGALATGAKVGTSPLGLWDYLGDVVERAETGHLRPHAELSPREYANAMEAGNARRLNETYGTLDESVPVIGGKGLGDLYQLGNSVGESLAWAGLSRGIMALGGSEKLAAGVTNLGFFGNAASQTTQDALARGATSDQALLLGLLSGAAEAAGETFSVDRLINTDAAAPLLLNMLKQAGVEASEESVTTLVNTFADELVMADKSELNAKIDNYILSGMSRQEAEKKAFAEWAEGLAFDALGGFLSGGVSSGMTTAGGRIQARQQEARAKAKTEAATALVEKIEGCTTDEQILKALDEIAADKKQSKLFAELFSPDGRSDTGYAKEQADAIRAELAEKKEQPAEAPQTAPNGAQALAEAALRQTPQNGAGAQIESGAQMTQPQGQENPAVPSPELNSQQQTKPQRQTATAATEGIRQKYGATMRVNDVRGKIKALSDAAKGTDFNDPAQVRALWEQAKKDAGDLLNSYGSGETSGKMTLGTEGGIRDYLRQTKIRITDAMRGDVPSGYEGFADLYRKTRGRLNLSSKEGIGLDAAYAEMQEMFGKGLFPDAAGHADMMENILWALANESSAGYTYAEELQGRDYDYQLAELTMDLMRAAEGVTERQIPTPQREAVQQTEYASDEERLAAEREAAIQSELDADFEGELSREDAERIVDQRYADYGKYDMNEILAALDENNRWEDEYDENYEGEEFDDGGEFDEYAYYAEQYRPAAQEADQGGSAGGETQLPADVEARASEGGPAENDGARAGGVREPGSPGPVSETALAERGPQEMGEPQPAQKRSQYEEHTQQAIDKANGVPEEVMKPLWYLVKTEKQSMAEAAARLSADRQGEIRKMIEAEAWSGVQYDAARQIESELRAQAKESGDWTAYEAWRKIKQQHETATAQGLQATKKDTRHIGESAVEAASEALADSKLPQEEKNKIMNEVSEYADRLDSIKEGDTASLRELIKDLAKKRGNWTLIKGKMDKLLNQQGESWLREAAYRQLEAIPRDELNKGKQNLGSKIASYRVLAMLSGVPTILRNLEGNTLFGMLDLFSEQGPARMIDAVLGNITGQRAVVGSRENAFKTVPEWWSNAVDNMERSLLESALDIDTEASESRPYDMPANSAFIASGGKVERLFQRWTQIMNYALVSSDRFFRGGIESGEQANYKAYDEKMAAKGKRGTGLTEEEQTQLAQNTANYRLFQNETAISKGQQALRKWLNNFIGFGGSKDASGKRTADNTFGLGSLLMPFIEVPTNLALKTAEYSPLNVMKGLVEIGQLAKFAHENSLADAEHKQSTAALQQKASMDIARGMTGTMLMAAFAALAKMGIIRNGDDEDDYDVMAADQLTGQKGTQWNLSAMNRAITGGSAEWQDGDTIIGMSGISPIDMFMNAGTRFAALGDSDGMMDWMKGRSSAYLQASLQTVLDMPLFQTLGEFQNTIRDMNSLLKGETWAKLGGNIVDSAVSSFIPQMVRQGARAADPYVRDVKGDTWMEQRVNNLLQYLPGARNTLPAAVDSFGNPKEQAAAANRWINYLVSPNAINTYEQNDVLDALADLRDETGKSNFYPNRKAPNNFDYEGETIELNTAEKRMYQTVYGNAVDEMYSNIIQMDSYEEMPAELKKWLFSECEEYANYLAKKAVMDARGEEYSNAQMEKLDDVAETGVDIPDYLAGKKQANEDGEGSLKSQEIYDWLAGSDYTDEQKSAIWDANKGSSEKSWDEYYEANPYTILHKYGMPDETAQRLVERFDATVNSAKRMTELGEAYKAGVDPDTWGNAWDEYKRLDKSNQTATQKAIDFVTWLDKQGKLTQNQKDLLRKQFTFFSQMSANTSTFDKLMDGGLSAQTAADLYDRIGAITPMPGNTGVTQNQKIVSIATADLSEDEKWAALKVYASEKCYNSAMQARAQGKTFEQWAKSYVK